MRFLYVLLTRHLPLRADELEYDYEGRMIAAGHWWWSKAVYGIPHPSANKAPLYPLWVGFWYTLFGHHPLLVRFVQIPIGAVVIWPGGVEVSAFRPGCSRGGCSARA